MVFSIWIFALYTKKSATNSIFVNILLVKRYLLKNNLYLDISLTITFNISILKHETMDYLYNLQPQARQISVLGFIMLDF